MSLGMHGTFLLLSRVWMDTRLGYCEKCLREQREAALTEELTPFTLSVYFYMRVQVPVESRRERQTHWNWSYRPTSNAAGI